MDEIHCSCAVHVHSYIHVHVHVHCISCGFYLVVVEFPLFVFQSTLYMYISDIVCPDVSMLHVYMLSLTDPKYVSTFLLGHRHFATSDTLMTLLIKRYPYIINNTCNTLFTCKPHVHVHVHA